MPSNSFGIELKRIRNTYGINDYCFKDIKTLQSFLGATRKSVIISGYKLQLEIDYINEKLFLLIFDKNNCLIEKKIYWDFDDIIKNETLKSVFCNQSINESVDAFLAVNLNLATASTNSYVHRNTLLYRIGKIKKLIGLDLKVFEDCVLYVNARNVFYMLKACDF